MRKGEISIECFRFHTHLTAFQS